MSDPCPDCGRDRVLVGYRHNCNPVPAWVADQDRTPVQQSGGIIRKAGEAPKVKAPSNDPYVAGLQRRVAELEAESCTNCVTLQARITELEAKLVTLQKKGAERVAKHRAKKNPK